MAALDVGIHDGISFEAYHADRLRPEITLSRSGIVQILSGEPMSVFAANNPRLRSPAWPKLERDATKASDTGEIVHRLVLGVGCEYEVKDAWDFANKDGTPSKTWGSAEAAKFKADCEARGVPIISHEKHELVVELTAKLTAAIEARFGKDAWARRRVEQVVLWRRVLNSHCDKAPDCDHYALCWIWCRAIVDALLPDGTIFELKSTELSLSDTEIGKATALRGYDIQSEFYKSGVRACGVDCRAFVFGWGQVVPPLDVAFYDLADVNWPLSMTNMLIDYACHKFAASVLENAWPGRNIEAHPRPPAWWVEQKGLQLLEAGLIEEAAL